MARRLHPLWALLAVVALASLSGNARFMTLPEHEPSAGTPASAKGSKSRQPRKKTPASSMTALMIPVYSVGSLLVEVPKPTPKSKKISPPKPAPAAEQAARSTPGEKQTVVAAPSLNGERPALSFDYAAIGFARYVTVLEQRVGRTFALIVDENGGLAVGSEISLLRRAVRPKNKTDMGKLEKMRPQIIKDPEIQARLAGLSLPAGAQPDRTVLYFYKRFDESLWRVIATALSRRGHKFEDIASIQGRYMPSGSSIYLELATAVRKDGRKLPLGNKIRVTL